MISRRPAPLLALTLAALGLALALAPAAQADAIRLRDGKWLPKQLNDLVPAGQEPDATVLEETRGSKITALGYDSVKLGTQDVPAAQVADVYVLECLENSDFQQGQTDGSAGFFAEAADSFARAANTLKGVARQVAINQRAVAVAQLNEIQALLPVIEQMTAEFPKAFYMPDLVMRKTRGLLANGDAEGAKSSLAALIGAPGLNKRALYAAELERVQLFEAGLAGKDKTRLAAAEQSYRSLLTRIEAESGAKDEVASARLRAQVGIGRMLVFQGDLPKAKPFLQQVIDAPATGGDAALLASAYTAFGDVMFSEASAKQASAGGNQAARKEAYDLLEGALLHYLRVTELYGESAERGDLYSARVNAARVFAALFTLTNDADCETARSAYRYYADAYRMLGAGAERNEVGKQAQELKARMDKACAKPAAAPAK